jgi:DNA-binding transcriptional ArsR family regulator
MLGTTPEASFPPASVFAALGDRVRLRLVERLCSEGPLSITSLSSGAAVTRQAITKHLHVLARAGVVQSARQGREQVWRVEAERLRDAREALDAISRQWDEVLARLKMTVEGDRG